jgi:hypothetical protein
MIATRGLPPRHRSFINEQRHADVIGVTPLEFDSPLQLAFPHKAKALV